MDATTTVEAAPERALPELRRVLIGLCGFGALGVAGALGAHGAHPAAMPSGLWTTAGALMLTGPALLVGHQFLGLKAAPDQVVGALARALARGGELALGLVPFQLFFSVTTQRGSFFLAVLLSGIGAAALLAATQDVVDAERAAGVTELQLGSARLLTAGWGVLTVLVGLRLGWEVLA